MSASEMMLMIRNKGSLDRDELFYFGASSKRIHLMSDLLIGRRGTGLKIAIVGALKLGLEMIITSTDKLGQYTMSPVTRLKEINGQTFNELVYLYQIGGVESEKRTQIFIEALEQSIQPIGRDDKMGFRILRELITNAYDAGRVAGKDGLPFEISWVDKKECRAAKTDEVIVYIKTYHDFELALEEKELPKYFKFFKPGPAPLFQLPGIGEIYPKSDPNTTRLFVRGTLVGVEENDALHSSSFDYSVDDQDVLNDEALIKDEGLFKYYVARMLSELTDRAMIATIIRNIATLDGYWENSSWAALDFPPAPSAATAAAYHGVWNKKAIIASETGDFDHRASELGYMVHHFNFTSAFRAFLKICGIRESTDVVPVQGKLEYTFIDVNALGPQAKYDFETACELFYAYIPRAKMFPLRLIKVISNSSAYDLHALAGDKKTNLKEIYLNIKYFNAAEVEKKDYSTVVEFILATLLHEFTHCETKATDYTNAFIKGSFKLSARLIIEQSKK